MDLHQLGYSDGQPGARADCDRKRDAVDEHKSSGQPTGEPLVGASYPPPIAMKKAVLHPAMQSRAEAQAEEAALPSVHDDFLQKEMLVAGFMAL